jgi:hypothetical protein
MRLARTGWTAIALAVSLFAFASASGAQTRMWVGFHDDPVFRYGVNRQQELDLASFRAHATVVRTLLTWAVVAPTRPQNPSDPFDPVYRFADLDDFVRSAQARGLEVLITIWGTPSWANGGKPARYLPTRVSDFQSFARAVAARYSGRYAGYPFVRFFGIWNESNLGNFLARQFDAHGRIISPANYARLAAAGYAGIKAGSPRALVAIGETSSHGRNRKKPGVTDTVAPATFARLVAKANPRLRFDAWAHHPYPYPVNQAPTQRVRYPNVALTTMPRFERDLARWFRRRSVAVWITEYGSETRPGEPNGVTEAQQARYVTQALTLARLDPRVPMFIWFVFRDSAGSPWQSGLYRKNGTAKPALSTWSAAAKQVNQVDGRVAVKSGTRSPTITLYLRSLCATNPIGSSVTSVAATFLKGKAVQSSLARTPLQIDCTTRIRLTGLKVARNKIYTARVVAQATFIPTLKRTITIVGI